MTVQKYYSAPVVVCEHVNLNYVTRCELLLNIEKGISM